MRDTAKSLYTLMEECGEVIYAASKFLRFGADGFNPEDSTRTTNRQLLEQELGDVLAMIGITEVGLIAAKQRKLVKLKRWLPEIQGKEENKNRV